MENESVNLPDWQSLTFRIEDGAWLDLATVTASGYVQELDLCRGWTAVLRTQRQAPAGPAAEIPVDRTAVSRS